LRQGQADEKKRGVGFLFNNLPSQTQDTTNIKNLLHIISLLPYLALPCIPTPIPIPIPIPILISILILIPIHKTHPHTYTHIHNTTQHNILHACLVLKNKDMAKRFVSTPSASSSPTTTLHHDILKWKSSHPRTTRTTPVSDNVVAFVPATLVGSARLAASQRMVTATVSIAN
jgi:hypothetical protein